MGETTGTFIVFEGGEGAGKSTLIRLLADLLTAAGFPVTVTHQPGDTAVGRQIRAILLDPATGLLDDRCEALLYAADRAEHVATVIRPALAAGRVVLCDRYWDSSVAYQGSGRGLGRETVLNLSRWAADGLTPDLTVVLDLPPEVGLARTVRSEFDGADRIEAETLDYHRAVRQTFLDLAKAEPHRYRVLDATQPIAAIIRQAEDAVVRVSANRRARESVHG